MQLLGEHAIAKSNGMEMVVTSLEGQIAANLKRWTEVREKVCSANPEAVRIWRDLRDKEIVG